MRKIMKMTSALLVLGLVFMFVTTSFKDDKDPADKDFFIGTYTGHITFKNTEKGNVEDINKEVGKIRVLKVGKSYNFSFSDKIPTIKNVKFDQKGEHSVTSIGSDESHYIRINDENLEILYHSGDETWTARGTRD